MSEINDKIINDLKDVIHKELEDWSSVEKARHEAHHEMLQDWIDLGLGKFIIIMVQREEVKLQRDKDRAELYKNLQAEVLKWGLIALLGWGISFIVKKLGVSL